MDMNKERLEKIIYKAERTALLTKPPKPLVTISDEDFEWLIEQVERVQELEEENKQIRQMKYHGAYEQGKFDTNMKVWYEMPKLEQQNKRYRETIEFAINHLRLVKEIGQVDMVINLMRHILEGEK